MKAANAGEPATGIRRIELRGVDVGYGQLIVLRGIDFSAAPGECIGLLGPNGAGKSTLLGCMAGILGVTRGTVAGDGEDITDLSAERRRRRGMTLVPEGRRIFPSLTVEETLRFAHEALGARRAAVADAVERAYERFPQLSERRTVAAGLLSGGEQQMLSLARAMAGDPTTLLIDEPFMGLAPPICEGLIVHLAQLRSTGVTMVVADESESMIGELAPDRLLDVRDLGRVT